MNAHQAVKRMSWLSQRFLVDHFLLAALAVSAGLLLGGRMASAFASDASSAHLIKEPGIR
jgi:hypothetical protein